MTNSVGACSEAATVWPTSTLRPTTMPSMGERMMVWSRSTCAWFTAAAACVTAAWLALSWASALREVVRAVSRSASGRSCSLASSSRPVASFCRASSQRGPLALHVGAGRDQVGLGLAHAGLEGRGVEPGHDLVLASRAS